MSNTSFETQAEVLRECRQILERNSKSFAMAAKLLSPLFRDRVAAVYAFCRRVDDAIDNAPAAVQPVALVRLQQELNHVYAGLSSKEPALRAFQAVVRQCNLPRLYPSELIEGMAMDVLETRYETLEDLLLYCHRVAGVVGLMMCHVFGVTRDDALLQAAHLGIAMQLTNICRDVEEDWQLGRLYLPRQMLARAGAKPLPDDIAGPFPTDPATLHAMQEVMRSLLREADRYYASAERGIHALPFRAGLAVRAAGALYHAIGRVVASHDYDPTRGRAIVPTRSKLAIVGRATLRHLSELPVVMQERLINGLEPRAPQRELVFSRDVLCDVAPTFSPVTACA